MNIFRNETRSRVRRFIAGLVVGGACGSLPAQAVTTSIVYHVEFQRIVPLSSSCGPTHCVNFPARPMLPANSTIISNVLRNVYVDDQADLSGGTGTLTLGGCNDSGWKSDVELKTSGIARSDGSFDVALCDNTTNNVDGSNEIKFSGDQAVTYGVASPLPPAVTDTNSEEQICQSSYDECTRRYEIVCWYRSAGCSDCGTYGSPRVSFGLANFNVRVEDTPIWEETSVGPALALAMRFSNYADASTNKTFGPKWSCNWESSVTVLNSKTNRMVFPSGSVVMFTQSVANVFLPPAALDGTLVKTNSIFRYAQPDGWSWDYAQSGSSTNLYLLSAVRDAWSNVVSVSYTNGDRLCRVQQTSPDTGRFLEFAYDGTNSRVLSVSTEAPDSTNATFTYSAEGWLGQVRDMGGHNCSYAYTNGYLRYVFNGVTPRASVTYSGTPNTWTSNTAYWVQIADASGVARTYTWLYGLVREDVTRGVDQLFNYYNVSTAGTRGRVLTGTLKDGNQESYQYDSQGRVTNYTDRTGARWRQTYNSQHRRLTYTDPASNTTTYVYATNGVDLLYESPPTGPVQRVYSYVPGRHAVASESNALGQVVTYAYNSMGQATNISDGRTTNEFLYDAEGRLVAHWRGGKLVVTNEYDDRGRLYWSRDAAGLEVWRNYDGLNRLTTAIVDNDGQVSTNRFEYDCCFLSRVIDRDDRAWNFQFNDAGEQQWVVNPAGLTNFYSFGVEGMPVAVSNALQWTTRQYTPEGRLKTVALPTNRSYDTSYHAENFWYDGEGRLVKWQNVAGAYFSNQYDQVGNQVGAAVPDGSTLGYGVEEYVLAETNRYDALGRKWWTKDIRGLATSNAFNALGQVLKTWHPDGSAEEWTYNRWGDATSYKDRAGGVVSNEYDSLGRLCCQVDARQFRTYYAYDDADRITSVSNAIDQTWQLSYDAERRVRQIVYPGSGLVATFFRSPMGLVTQQVANGVVRTMTYDKLGKRTSMRVVGLLVESNRCDQLGRLAWGQNADGLAISNAWDSWGKLMGRQWPSNRTETYQFSERGRTNAVNRQGGKIRESRDSMGRLLRREYALYYPTASVEYSYLSNGVDQINCLWDGRSNRTAWAHDEYGRVTNKVYADGSRVSRQYDRMGRLANRTDAANVSTRYGYDANGNLTTLAPGADSAIAYGYDARNRLTNMVDGSGTTAWTYDMTDDLRGETGSFGTTVCLDYDAWGQITNIGFAGRTWSYQYDALGRVTNLVAPEGVYRLGYLNQGVNKQSICYPNGLLAQIQYDNGTRPTNLFISDYATSLMHCGYAYFDDDNLSSVTQFGSSNNPVLERTFNYDYGTGQMASEYLYPGVIPVQKRYDGAGNSTQVREYGLGVSNIFNSLNQIVASTWTGGTISVSGVVNYNAGTVTVNGAVARRAGLMYEATNVSLAVGTNTITAVYRGPAYTNVPMVATSVSEVVVGSTSYGYDANGNLTNDANYAYQYDALYRLTNVVCRTNGASILANRYDGLGRRVEAIRNGTNTERYVYVPGTFLVLAVLDGSNNVKQTFTHGPDLSGTLDGAGGIGGFLAQTDEITTYYLHPDVSGNVGYVSDASGTIVGTNRYAPFGSLISRIGAFEGRYMFSSKEWEPAVGLYYYGYRFYSPSLGRWLSRDPLGEQADPLHNLYRFVGNNPLNYVDPYGLQQNPQTRELENRARAMGAGGAYVFSAAGPPSYKPGGGKELPAPPVSTPAPKSSPNAYPPNRGFMPGEGTPASLLPGAVVDRYGDPTGSFLSPQGTPVAARSLSPGAENRPLNTYDVMRPIPVDAGRIAPYYNQTGLGIQFDIWPFSVQDYVESGHLCPRK